MMKKKYARSEEIENAGAGDITNNKDINSQDENGLETGSDVYGETDQPSEVNNTSEARDQDKSAEPAKEATIDISAEVKLAEMQDKYLRLSAEFDNYRKRTLREKIELTKHAGEDILIKIVPVMDDFERALKLIDASPENAAMKAGIELIYYKFRDFMFQNGIKEIEALNCDFNVDLHDAISKIKVTDETQKGKVVDVVQKGYYLHDKVMRHSKVVVGE